MFDLVPVPKKKEVKVEPPVENTDVPLYIFHMYKLTEEFKSRRVVILGFSKNLVNEKRTVIFRTVNNKEEIFTVSETKFKQISKPIKFKE